MASQPPSQRPPRLRDTTSIADRVRQDRLNALTAGGPGFMRGLSPLPRRRGTTAAFTESDNGGSPGTDQSLTRFENTDAATASGPGDMVVTLSHYPIPESVQVWWGSTPLLPTDWALTGNVVTIPDPTSLIRAGHVFTAYYAYTDTSTPDTPSLDWGSSGPNLVVAEGSMTDYSALAFNDAGWAAAAAPLGHPLGPNAGRPAWPPVVTDTASTNAGLWLRRHFTVSDAATLTIRARIDGQWWLYCDGTLVDSGPTLVGTAEVGPFAVSVDAGSHVVALHVNDDTTDPPGDYLYGDLNVAVSG